MTKKALEKLNRKQRQQIEAFRSNYSVAAPGSDMKDQIRGKAHMYVKALEDSEILDEFEARAVFLYTTVGHIREAE